MLDIGPQQIMFTITTTARRNAIQLCERINFFFGFGSFITAIVMTTTSAKITPSAIRYDLQEFKTLITSSILIANISLSSLFFIHDSNPARFLRARFM